ncbi:hypothetical protein CE143_20055 [Photorhabdus luminescens]|uniref:Uncharacterized protein n=1 Tax=Photorhabdus akhurstii TaxID=171438 RepID=A0ABX8LXG6_9GAMM|nr:hypothetical protein [Photorhabdus akhurstii]QXF35205.1 hypothetical protein B0X70_20010 [Photorhabdus akhurstii]UJD77038.1 hypothetical protein CE143_20055 [Photorhabdus luminescens]
MSDNKRHVHAELMMQYAQDAMKTNEPWKLWEMFCFDREWRGLNEHPRWDIDKEYRRKPEIITVGKVSFPKPVNYNLVIGTTYYTPNLINNSKLHNVHENHKIFMWENDSFDFTALEQGLIHLTPSAAEEHYDAICRINYGQF